MSFILTETLEARIVEVTISTKMTRDVYLAFIQTAELAIQKKGTIRVLFLMLGFNGWEAGAVWADVLSGHEHFEKIERVAIVGESKWESGATLFCQPFSAANIKYFKQSDLGKAREWVSDLST